MALQPLYSGGLAYGSNSIKAISETKRDAVTVLAHVAVNLSGSRPINHVRISFDADALADGVDVPYHR
jgi:hypothetical protein